MEQSGSFALKLFLTPGVLLFETFLHHGGLTVGSRDTILGVTSSLVACGLGLFQSALTNSVGLLGALGDIVAAGLLMGGRLFEQLLDFGCGLIVAGAGLVSNVLGFLPRLGRDSCGLRTSLVEDLGNLGASILIDGGGLRASLGNNRLGMSAGLLNDSAGL